MSCTDMFVQRASLPQQGGASVPLEPPRARVLANDPFSLMMVGDGPDTRRWACPNELNGTRLPGRRRTRVCSQSSGAGVQSRPRPFAKRANIGQDACHSR